MFAWLYCGEVQSYEWVNKKTGGLGSKASVNWGDQRMNWGLRTKASSNWLDQWVNRKFRYQGINTLIRLTDKPKVEGLMIISCRAQGPMVDWRAQGSQSTHKALWTNKLYSLRSTRLIDNPLAKHKALVRMNVIIWLE